MTERFDAFGCSDNGLFRRRYLAAIGAVGAGLVAGCSGTDGSDFTGDESGSPPTTSSDGETTTTTSSDTEITTTDSTMAGRSTTTHRPEPTEGSETPGETDSVPTTETSRSGGNASALEILGTEVVGSGFEIGVIGKIKNTGQQRLSYIEAKMTFRNDAGDVIGRMPTTIIVRGLEPGQIWEVYVPYLGESPELAEGTLSIKRATAGAIPAPPENAELLEHSLEPPEEAYVGSSVVGRAKNTGTSKIDYLEASATFTAANGNLLSSGYTIIRDFPAGETWSFEIDFRGYTANAAKKTTATRYI